MEGNHFSPNYDRLLALSSVVTVGGILLTSEVGISLWFIEGGLAESFALLYIVMLITLLIDPININKQKICGALGLIFWLSRGLAFLDLVFSGRVDLTGAVLERGHTAILVSVMWHLFSIKRIAVEESRILHGN